MVCGLTCEGSLVEAETWYIRVNLHLSGFHGGEVCEKPVRARSVDRRVTCKKHSREITEHHRECFNGLIGILSFSALFQSKLLAAKSSIDHTEKVQRR
jgi:hypothetical protein